jgi:hypothetical protein
MNFQKATCEPRVKAKKPSSVRLISHIYIKANRVAIVISVITIQCLFDGVLLFYLILLFSIQIIQYIFCPDPGNVFQVF